MLFASLAIRGHTVQTLDNQVPFGVLKSAEILLSYHFDRVWESRSWWLSQKPQSNPDRLQGGMGLIRKEKPLAL